MRIIRLGLLIGATILINSCVEFSGRACVIGVYDNYNCVPLKSYQSWNECRGDCKTELRPKTKSYGSEDNRWVRPRPYAYP